VGYKNDEELRGTFVRDFALYGGKGQTEPAPSKSLGAYGLYWYDLARRIRDSAQFYKPALLGSFANPMLWNFNVRIAPIVLKKSFLAMTENSQDRWCVSLAAT
jgi:hypothetical protein